jgi:hypothetical protein
MTIAPARETQTDDSTTMNEIRYKCEVCFDLFYCTLAIGATRTTIAN